MSAVISKTTYTFTCLHRSDSPPHDLEDALRESFDGDAVGAIVKVATEPIAEKEVPDQLQMLGNDGTFFAFDLDEALPEAI